MTEIDAAVRLGIAGLVGLAAGIERERSGHAAGADARFAGVRTFLMLGLVGGAAGVLLASSFALAGAMVAVGGMSLCIVAYFMAVRRPGENLDGTTEAAALVIVALGVVAGIGWLVLAAGAGSLVVLALSEKTWLHTLVSKIEEQELRATLQFAVLALVVLPLLPAGPVLGALDLKPRALWIVVLLFSGVSYAGHIARRFFGARHGYVLAGALGGTVSSTAVTLTFARHSAREPALAEPLAGGTIAASGVLAVRAVVLSFILNPDVGRLLAPLLLPQALVAALLTMLIGRRGRATVRAEESENPLALGTAIKMAVAFEVAVLLLQWARRQFGEMGLYGTGAALGFIDMDALTFSMNRAVGIDASTIAHVIAIGIIANGTLKLVLAIVLGTRRYRVLAGAGLVSLMIAGALALAF